MTIKWKWTLLIALLMTLFGFTLLFSTQEKRLNTPPEKWYCPVCHEKFTEDTLIKYALDHIFSHNK